MTEAHHGSMYHLYPLPAVPHRLLPSKGFRNMKEHHLGIDMKYSCCISSRIVFTTPEFSGSEVSSCKEINIQYSSSLPFSQQFDLSASGDRLARFVICVANIQYRFSRGQLTLTANQTANASFLDQILSKKSPLLCLSIMLIITVPSIHLDRGPK